jgi:2-(1,2-epoxy-1,2-dihydrophenyl)acetyl-CoA isomerase
MTAVDETRVLLDIRDGVASVTLNNPGNGNAIDVAMAAALRDALRRCEGNESVRAIVIAGAGKMFCSGGDLRSIRAADENAPAYVGDILLHLHEAIAVIARISAPVIARVHGSAAGAGLGLAIACDFVVAAKSTKFLMAYTAAGLTPDGSSSWFLPRLIGLRRALELTLRNRRLSADEAQEWGLVNEVVEDESLATHVDKLAAEISDGATAAFGDAKRLLRTSFDNCLETQMAREGETLARALTRPEAAIGLAAFAEKRTPKFR